MKLRSLTFMIFGVCFVSALVLGGPAAFAQAEPKAKAASSDDSYGKEMKQLEERQQAEVKAMHERHRAERNTLRQSFGKGPEAKPGEAMMEKTREQSQEKVKSKEQEMEQELEKTKTKAREQMMMPEGGMMPTPEKGGKKK